MQFSSLGNLARPSELARFLRTVRHLRPRQVVYGVKYRLLNNRPAAAIPLRPRSLRFRVPGLGAPDPRTWDGADAFTFQNATLPFAGDWVQAGATRLWRYHLHYMDWIHETADGREAWILRWIRDNPEEAGGTGWEPYPLARRLSSWCRHYASAGAAPTSQVLESMGRQAGRLLVGLEYHLDANHLLENLLALAFVFLWTDDGDRGARSARAARDRVMADLHQEMDAQFLTDGGHYELSPMYHAALLERLLDLLNAWPDTDGRHGHVRAALAARTGALLDWLDTMSVGGRYALFNDAAYGMAPDTPGLLAYGKRLLGHVPKPTRALVSLESSGYHRASLGDWTLIFDAGRLGPDHQLGHAHCDMLSFCLWHEGRPLVVHPGTYGYAPGEMRDYCRSTKAHNTVAVDGVEQAETWGAHRVGRRGYPLGVEARELGGEGAISLVGSHGGYSHLHGRPIHRRSLRLTAEGVNIRDEVTSGRPCSNQAFLHLSPECAVEPFAGGHRVRLGSRIFNLTSSRPLSLVGGWYCPEFGLKIPNPTLVADFTDGVCEVRLYQIRGD